MRSPEWYYTHQVKAMYVGCSLVPRLPSFFQRAAKESGKPGRRSHVTLRKYLVPLRRLAVVSRSQTFTRVWLRETSQLP